MRQYPKPRLIVLYKTIRGLPYAYDFSNQEECDEEFHKAETLKELLPDWKWYDVYDEIEYAEKRIKKEDEESDHYDDYEEQWQTPAEKEDAQIDEMFSALRWS